MSERLTLPRPRLRETVVAAPGGHTPRPAPDQDGSRAATVCLIAICALVLGAWLPASHYVLGYPFTEGAEDAFFSELLAGVIVGCAGYGRLQSPLHLPKLTVLQAAAGAWLAAAPWLIGYAQDVPPARLNDVACGVAAVLLAAAGALASRPERRRVPPKPTAGPAARRRGRAARPEPTGRNQRVLHHIHRTHDPHDKVS